MKRKYMIPVLWLLVIAVAVCGGAAALMFRQTQRLDNHLIPAIVDCVVHEKVDNDDRTFTQGAPNADQKKSIRVENTGNIDAYIRVRFVSYWIDEGGRIMPKSSEMPAVSITDHWIAVADHTFYCKTAIAPDKFTPELLTSPIVLSISGEGYRQVVEVFADAIQSLPEDAAESRWGVTITDGVITGGK